VSARDQRYRQQRDRYRTDLVEVAAAAVVSGVTVVADFLPDEPDLRADVRDRAQLLAREVAALAGHRA
jgi:hypothetical protein